MRDLAAAAVWGDVAAVVPDRVPDLFRHDEYPGVVNIMRRGLRNRIRADLRVSDKLADLILEQWEEEATRRGLGPRDLPYWSEGARWIAGRFIDREFLD